MLEHKATIKVGGADFDPVPMDKYTCMIADVSYKMYTKYKSTEEEEQLNYKFVILDNKPVYPEVPVEMKTTRGRFLWAHVRQVLNPKSNFYKLAKGVYGRDLTAPEQKALAEDPQILVGKLVDVMVEQSTGSDGMTVYSNIVTYAKNVKPLPLVEVENKPEEVVERTSQPALAKVPDLMPSLNDPFAEEDLDSASGTQKVPNVNLAELDEDLEAMLEAMEERLKKAKAAKAKKDAKK